MTHRFHKRRLWTPKRKRTLSWAILALWFSVVMYLSLTAHASTYIKGPALVEGVTSTVSAASTTTLTAASETNQVITGSTTQTVKLPAANTLPQGRRFVIHNQSSGIVSVIDGNSGALKSLPSNTSTAFTVTSVGSVAGSWAIATNVPTLGAGVVHSDAGGTLSSSGVTSADITDGTIVNADINNAAAIAYSKLALTGSILNADLAGSIAYSKLVLTNSIVNADISSSAAIAYSKLALTGSILNADLAGSIAASKLVGSDIATVGTITTGTWNATAIARSKIATSANAYRLVTNDSLGSLTDAAVITASRALISDANGIPTHSTVTSTELGYVSGVTSAIQTQLGTKAPSASPTFTGTIGTPLTASRAVVTDGSSNLAASATTSTELGYVSGVTSAIQTQIDGKVAKSLYTAKGSLIAASAASTPVEVTVGANGTFLKADSTAGGGVSWASGNSNLSVVAKTTTYTATNSDDLITASGSAFTITLPAASGNSGKQLRFKKTDSSLSNIITISRAGSDTIDGATSITLNTQYEEFMLVSDGTSAWHITQHYIPSTYTTFTPTITNGGTTSTNTAYWQRIGNSIKIVYYTVYTGTGSAGNLSYSAPSGVTFDTTKTGAGNNRIIQGSGAFNDNSATTNFSLEAQLASSTTVSCMQHGNNSATQGNALGSSDVYSFWILAPVSGWSD